MANDKDKKDDKEQEKFKELKKQQKMRKIERGAIFEASKNKTHIRKEVPELGLELDTSICMPSDDQEQQK